MENQFAELQVARLATFRLTLEVLGGITAEGRRVARGTVMMLRIKSHACTAAFGALICTSSSAIALAQAVASQSDGAQAESAPISTSSALPTAGGASARNGKDDNAALTDVVITAERRKESLQKVGITVSAFNSNQLNALGITSAEDLATHIPNVNVTSGVGIASFDIRGIGLSTFAANLDSSIGVNVDEVYQSKPFMLGLFMFDLDRVEEASGPQGTLYGRNTTGGAINYYTHKPTGTFEVGGKIEYGDYDTVRAEGYVNLPLASNLNLRVSAFDIYQGDGYYYNTTLHETEDYDRNFAVRTQLRWNPAGNDVLVSVHFGREEGTLAPYQGLGVYTPQSYAQYNATGGLANISLLTPCQDYLNGTVTGGDASCVRGDDGRYPGTNNPYTTEGHNVHPIDDMSFGGMLHVVHDFSRSTLTSISAYEDFVRDSSEVGDGSALYNGTWLFWYSHEKQFTQEVRLTSKDEGAWSYVVGGFYEHENLATRDYLTVGLDETPAEYGFFTDVDQSSNAISFFTNQKLLVNRSFSLIGGLRYNYERFDVSGGTCAGSGLTGAIIQRPSGASCPVLSSADALSGGPVNSDQNFSYKIGGEYTPDLNISMINSLLLYANISTGYRSAGYNYDLATDQASFTKLHPEVVTAIEAGFKTQLFYNRVRVNGDIFHYDFKNGIISVDVDSLVPVTANAARINTWGAELSSTWEPIEGLNLTASGGWLDAKIESDLTSAGVPLRGNQPVDSPPFTFNGEVSYTRPITDAYRLSLDLNGNWRDAQYLQVSNKPDTREAAYWLLNGSVGFGTADGHWSLRFWVKNLTQTVYRTYINDLYNFGWLLNIYNPPRTFGATLEFKFK